MSVSAPDERARARRRPARTPCARETSSSAAMCTCVGEVLPLFRRRAAHHPAPARQVHDRPRGCGAVCRREHDRRRGRPGDDVHRPFRRHPRDQRPADQAARREGDRRPAARRRGERGASSDHSSTPTPHGTSGSSRCDRSTSRATSSASSTRASAGSCSGSGATSPRISSATRTISARPMRRSRWMCCPARLPRSQGVAPLAGPHRVRHEGSRRPSSAKARAHGNTTVFVKVSTGVGAGIVPSGALVRGYGGQAGEIGHLVVRADCQPADAEIADAWRHSHPCRRSCGLSNRCMDGSTSPRWRASSPPATRRAPCDARRRARPSGRR